MSLSVFFVCSLLVTGCSGGAGVTVPKPTYGTPGPATTPTSTPGSSQSALANAPGSQYVETPLSSDSFADSVGVNTHIPSYFSASDYPTVVARVASLGVRHIRDAILDAYPPYDTAVATLLGAANAKLDGLTDCTGIEYYAQSPTTPSDIQAFNTSIGNRLEIVEGPNEVDNRNDNNWASDTRNCLPSLRGALPTLPFAAPSLANQLQNAPTLGDISGMVDLGNDHRYFSGRNPGTRGWGGTFPCGVYGALNWSLCETQIISGSKPILVTETGYNSQGEVDEQTQAKYLSRMFLVNLQAGIIRSYIYDLKDYAGGDGFGGDGLIRTDDSQKPAYEAVASELAYFANPGATFALTPLTYALAAPGLSHLLFMKRDGTYVLALWNETPSWDPIAQTPIVVAPISATLTLPFVASPVHGVTLQDSGVFAPTSIVQTGTSYTIPVGDQVTLVAFKAS